MREHLTGGRSTRASGDEHDTCHLLLPWLTNGTLDEMQRQRLEAHLATCESCRAEAAEQALLREHVLREDSVVYAPQASLQKLLSRIDGSPPEQRPNASNKRGRAASPRWMVAAALLCAIGVGMVAGRSWWRVQDQRLAPRYTTLTSEPGELARTPAARVVFAPTTSVARLSELLRQHRARVVAGPTEAGVYTLTFMSADHEAAARAAATARAELESQAIVEASIEELRREPDVLFAEPVLTGSPVQ